MEKKVIKIKKEELKGLSCHDVHFVMMAEGGAMGEPGAVYIVKNPGKVYHCNYVYEDITYKEVEEALPMLKESKFGLFGYDSTTPEGWNYVNLGAGNHLIVREDVYDEFIDIVGEDKAPSKIYGTWLDAALEIYEKRYC